MPDIKTALQNAFSKAAPAPQIPAAWDDEGADAAIENITTKAKEATMPKKYFQTTNNVTRETFDHVKNNPGQTRTQAIKALKDRGFKHKSTTSLLSQMVRQDLIREVRGLLYVQAPEYTPLKSTRAKARGAVVAKPVVKEKAQAKPRPTFIPPTEAPVQINAAWDAETLLNNLSIKQARALYDELRKIFGG